jgi:integrase/recombinase XerD
VTEEHEVQAQLKLMEIVVTLKPLHHRGKECIGIYFENYTSVNNVIRNDAGAKWSDTRKTWYTFLTREDHKKLIDSLRGKAIIEQSALYKYLSDKKRIRQEAINVSAIHLSRYRRLAAADKEAPPSGAVIPAKRSVPEAIHLVNAHVLPAILQMLRLKAYSESTIKIYITEMRQLLLKLGPIRADDLKPEHLKRYLVYCFEKLQLKENTLHSRINALKFYYEQVLGKEKFFWEIPRPKKPLLLPKLLNETELRRLFNSLGNKKHKAMLFTAYSAGLRVSEIVNLKIADIDSKRMQIFIGRAKGKKDRYVNLSPLVLDILRKYFVEYKPRPKEYLFESGQTFQPYPTRTVQQIFSNAKRKAGIRKEVGVHSLRHSFATHLLDKGTDIRYIKELLGHFNITTTERYLHVSRRQLVNVISPFDDLYNKEQLEW